MQEILFETELNVIQEYEKLLDGYYPTKHDKYNALDLIDWDFKEFQTQYLSHRFHSYPARFIPQIPKTFIKLFTDENDIIIDPFCGCGTTIVEAFLNRRDSIGNDFNPLACLVTKVKAQLISEGDLNLFGKKLMELKRYIDSDHRRNEGIYEHPKTSNNRI